MMQKLAETDQQRNRVDANIVAVDSDMVGKRGMNASPVVLALIASGHVSSPCRLLFQFIRHTKQGSIKVVLGMFRVPSSQTVPAIEEAIRRGLTVRAMLQRFRFDPFLIAQALRIIREYGVGLIESHGSKPGVLAWCLKVLTGLPWIAYVHGYTSESKRVLLYNIVDQYLLKHSDRVVVVSTELRETVMKLGVPKCNIRVIPNAVDPFDYGNHVRGHSRTAIFRDEFEAANDTVFIGVIGRLSREKGHMDFLEAFETVNKILPDARAVIIGDGPERYNLVRQVHDKGLLKKVAFMGFQENISRIYEGLDLVVIPSRSEGLPIVLLEALLHRRPVIATAVGAIPDVMSGVLERCLIPPKNPQMLASRIVEMISNHDLRNNFAEVGFRRVRNDYCPNKRASEIIDMYNEIMNIP